MDYVHNYTEDYSIIYSYIGYISGPSMHACTNPYNSYMSDTWLIH